MKYYYPTTPSKQTQGFGGNVGNAYAPLKGHPAHDFDFTWNVAVPFVANSYVYSRINFASPDPEKYTAVYTLVDTGPTTADEVTYGHLNSTTVKDGDYLIGETVGLAGNRGMTYFRGKRVTKEEKLAGSTKGTHLHLQRRPCKKVTKVTKGKRYLETSKGLLKKDGFYYEVIDPDNGFAGCAEITFNGEVATIGRKVTYEEALANLRKSLPKGAILSTAEKVLALVYRKK